MNEGWSELLEKEDDPKVLEEILKFLIENQADITDGVATLHPPHDSCCELKISEIIRMTQLKPKQKKEMK